MQRDRGRGAAFIAVVASMFMVGLITYGLPAGRAYADSGSEEQQFVARINAYRRARGLVALVVDTRLSGIARNWSEHMADSQQSSHNPDLAAEAGTQAKLGENVGNGASADWLEASFEQSPEHQQNLLDPDFRFVGVGVVDTPDVVWATQDFRGEESRAPDPGGSTQPVSPQPPAPTPSEQSPNPGDVRVLPPAAPPAPRFVAAPPPVITVAPAPAPVAPTSSPAPVTAPDAADTLRHALATWNALTG